jgi:DNA polymerase elongation subunit (family B)
LPFIIFKGKNLSYTDAFLDRNKDIIHVVERVDGKRKFLQYPVKYVFYYQDRKGKYKSIFEEPLTQVVCKSKKEFNKEKKIHSNKKLYESDTNPLFRFLAENYTNAITPNLNIGFFDLEVAFNKKLGFAPPEDPFNPITAVALHLNWLNKTICLAIKPDTLTHDQANDIINQFPDSLLMNNEEELLITFLDLIDDVDVLSGWNSTGFDIPYIVNRIKRILGREYTKKMCLWDQSPQKREYEKYGKINETYDLIGRQHLDYLELYRKYTYHEMHSYSLDAISEYELNEKKIAYEGTLDHLYNNDFYKFIDYNRQDVELLVKLDKKLQFIDLANVIAHDNCVILPTTMGSVAQIDQAIINEAHLRGMIVPDRIRVKNTKTVKNTDDDFYDYDDRIVLGDFDFDDDDDTNLDNTVAGAYVAQPKIGIHEWIGSIDLNSLYPSIIRALNMSPETLVGQIRLDLTNKMLKEYDKVVEAWEGKFATPEYELVMQKDKNTLLYIDFEDGTTIQATGAELYQIIFCENKPWMLSSNGSIFTTNKKGIIPGLLERWYKERKDLQKKSKSFKGVDDEEFAFWDKRQLVKKILLNSLYGALLNVGSRFFDARLGQSTTLTGRCIDRHMAATVNEIITGKYDYKGDAVIYCVDGSTELHINDNIETIKNLYDRINTTSKDGIKYLYNRDIFVLSLNPETEVREYKQVTAVSKQTVKKKMYKVWIDENKNVTVTEDHRFIVKRNGQLIEATVKELKSDDIFINIHGHTSKEEYQCMKYQTIQANSV